VQAVSQETFEAEVRQARGKVLVDFWAEWCGPCRTVGPVLDELEGEYPDVRFVQLNVDESPGVAQGYEVMSIPTLLAFESGAVVKRVVGALPKTKLIEELSDFLAQP
jgi:thioredoxin 1